MADFSYEGGHKLSLLLTKYSGDRVFSILISMTASSTLYSISLQLPSELLFHQLLIERMVA